jgi:hypothetical protein
MNEHKSLSTPIEQLMSLLCLDVLIERNSIPFDDFMTQLCIPYLSVSEEKHATDLTSNKFACRLLAKYVKKNVSSVPSNYILDHVERTITSSVNTSYENQQEESLDTILFHIEFLANLFGNDSTELTEYGNKLFSLLLQGLKVWPSAHRKLIIVSVLPPVIKSNPTQSNLKILWQTVCDMFLLGREVRIESYSILCQFYEQFFTVVENDKYKFDLRAEEVLWKMILDGLIVDDTFTKKRSIYLLKRILDMTKNNPKIKPDQWTRYVALLVSQMS